MAWLVCLIIAGGIAVLLLSAMLLIILYLAAHDLMLKKGHSINHKEYWEGNIEKYYRFFKSISNEELLLPTPLKQLYQLFIFPIERHYCIKRQKIVNELIKENISAGMTVVDLGCGGGIFTVELAKRGASVIAVDFVQKALEITRMRTEFECKEYAKSVTYKLLDITKEKLPHSDAVLAIGVMPYIESFKLFMDNVLPTTKILIFSYFNSNNFFNVIRRQLPFLNARRYYFKDTGELGPIMKQYKFYQLYKLSIATSYIDLWEKRS